jgi:ATP-dependent helicase/nuclease subunit A
VPAFSGALDGDLPLPAFARGVKNLAGTDIGTATHLVLEWLDVKRPCRGDDLERQIARLVESGRLPADHAAGVDRAGIEWFMDSPAGQVVRSAKQLLREVPFCLFRSDGSARRD